MTEDTACAYTLTLDDIRTLAEIGFIGLSAGLLDHAASVFDGIKAAHPNLEAGVIGGALVDIARGNLGPAIASLRSLAPTDAACTFLAMGLIHHGDHGEARSILLDVAASPSGGPIVTLARDLLHTLDEAPAPLAIAR